MKQSALIALIVSMQLLGQFLVQLLLVRLVGVGPETDAYIAAQAVPMVIGAVIITALQSVWLPRFSVLSADVEGWRREQGIAQGQAAILGMGTLALLGSTVSFWLPTVFPGLDARQQQDATRFTLLLLLSTGLGTQSALLTAALRARDRFIVSESITLLGTVFSLVAMYAALPIWGVEAAAWIMLARALVTYLAQLQLANWPPVAAASGWRNAETWALMKPLLFGTLIYKTSPIVDRYWASQGPAGTITVLTLAQTAITAGATVLERALGTPLVPTLSRLSAAGRHDEVRRIYKRFIARIAWITMAVAAVLTLLKDVLIRVFSQLLAMDSAFAHDIWLLFLLLLGHLFAAVTGALLVSVLYALNDTHTPVYIGITGFLFGLTLKWVLFGKLGAYGLAIATSTYFLLNILMFVVAIEKRLPRGGQKI